MPLSAGAADVGAIFGQRRHATLIIFDSFLHADFFLLDFLLSIFFRSFD